MSKVTVKCENASHISLSAVNCSAPAAREVPWQHRAHFALEFGFAGFEADIVVDKRMSRGMAGIAVGLCLPVGLSLAAVRFQFSDSN
ncbi:MULTISPECIES: hypothetical protein [unclassified Mesorhizobium]|uniref:hypothetical protein n=1 Tax=unclassified Mesorhizobium TaxID=325217 RepID=UPI001127175E|nr:MULTISPECIES: hypothetical protein [unclassified Mesorhizobium]TPK99019.1 hypothetical protein FJ567_17195 [Mesorhizobium sp. B2-4-16]TPL73719.1 hypothetical protein FJ956_08440 [Mesorhizobium sp. B2-4-3]